VTDALAVRTASAGPSDEEPTLLPRLTWRQVWGLALVLAAIAIGARAWVALQGYFLIDDYLFVIQASTHPLWSPDFLFRPHFGHLMPGGNALTWLLARSAPFSLPVFVAASVAMQALAALLAWRLLRQLFGRTPWLLVPFTVYLFSPLTLPAHMWWAAAVNALPLQITMTMAASSFVAYDRDHRTRHLLGTIGWTVAGLAFFEKGLLTPLLLLALGFVLSDERNPARAAWRVVTRSRRLWLALLALAVAYLAAYQALSDFAVRRTPDADYVRAVLRGGVVEGFLPALAGGPWRWIPFDTPAAAPPSALRWCALVAVVALVVVSSARRRAARRAWLALAAYVAVEILLLLLGRSLFPAIISQQYRYYADAVLLMTVAVAVAVVPRSASADAADPRPAPISIRPVPAVAVGLAVNLYVVSSLVSYASFAGIWRENPTKSYVQTAVASLQANPSVTVLDRGVPTSVVFAFQRDRDLSMLFGQIPRRAAFSRAPTSLFVLDDEGFLRRGVVAGVSTRPGPETGCGWRVAAGRTTRIPLQIPVYRWYFTVALRYAVPGDTRVRVGLDGPGRTWLLRAEDSSRYLPSGGGGRHVVVTNLGEEELCVRSATVGLAVPGPGAPL
jgi:hypothetical protein